MIKVGLKTIQRRDISHFRNLFTERMGIERDWAHSVPMELFSGETGLFIRKNILDIRRLVDILPPNETRKQLFYSHIFPSVIKLAQRFGIKPFTFIVKANPARAWVVCQYLGEMSELVHRVGIGPFVKVINKYQDAETILSEIRGQSFETRDFSGKQRMEYRYSMCQKIRTPADLLFYAEQIDQFINIGNICFEKNNERVGYLVEKYGIKNLTFFSQIAAGWGDRALQWYHLGSERMLNVEVPFVENKSIINAFGYQVFTKIYGIVGSSIDSIRKNFEQIGDIYPTPVGFLEALREIELIAQNCKKNKNTVWDLEALNKRTGLDWKIPEQEVEESMWECIQPLVDGLFGFEENKDLIRRFGLSAFRKIINNIKIPPFATLSKFNYLIDSEEKLNEVVLTLNEAREIDKYYLDTLEAAQTMMINSITDINTYNAKAVEVKASCKNDNVSRSVFSSGLPLIMGLGLIRTPEDFLSYGKGLAKIGNAGGSAVIGQEWNSSQLIGQCGIESFAEIAEASKTSTELIFSCLLKFDDQFDCPQNILYFANALLEICKQDFHHEKELLLNFIPKNKGLISKIGIDAIEKSSRRLGEEIRFILADCYPAIEKAIGSAEELPEFDKTISIILEKDYSAFWFLKNWANIISSKEALLNYGMVVAEAIQGYDIGDVHVLSDFSKKNIETATDAHLLIDLMNTKIRPQDLMDIFPLYKKYGKKFIDQISPVQVFGPGSLRRFLVETVDKVEQPEEILTAAEILTKADLFPTLKLINMINTGNAEETIKKLEEIKNEIKNRKFNPENALHVEVGYTDFVKLVEYSTKNSGKYSYNLYLSVLTANKENPTGELSTQDNAEIKFAAYEALRLKEYLEGLALKSERPILVVANLSYGRFALSPIEQSLRKRGFKVVFARIGSTECHNNPYLLKSDLFDKETLKYIFQEQPNIVIVDGTNHIIDRDGKGARYPDAHTGYLNFTIALNEVLTGGRAEDRADSVGRDDTFIKDLKKQPAFRQTIKIFKEISDQSSQPYSFNYWNPGGLTLALRDKRKTRVEAIPFKSEDIGDNPVIIMANVTMLHEHLPDELIEETGNIIHNPAYFDDSAHIQTLLFKVTRTGVKMTDELYDRIRDAYLKMNSKFNKQENKPNTTSASVHLPPVPMWASLY